MPSEGDGQAQYSIPLTRADLTIPSLYTPPPLLAFPRFIRRLAVSHSDGRCRSAGPARCRSHQPLDRRRWRFFSEPRGRARVFDPPPPGSLELPGTAYV